MKKILFGIFLAQCLVFPAFACMCRQSSLSPEASAENLKNAAFIFDGEILNILIDETNNSPKATFKIDKLYKGHAGIKSVEAWTDPTECNIYKPDKGAKDLYILYQTSYGLVTAGLCNSYIDAEALKALKNP